ncbi:MAG: ROK family protein [bacterium]
MRIGVDLGGTKIALVALDQQGVVCYEQRIATPQGDYHGTIAAITHLVVQAEQSLTNQALLQVDQHASIGVCTPGSLSPATGLLRNANSVCLNGQPFKQDLETQLARPIRMANDANCFALSEAIDGAAAEAQTVFGVIIGTGTGGAIVINRQVLGGVNGIAGEWGHNPLPWADQTELNGDRCFCGKRGCIETWLSGPGLSRQHYYRSQQRLSARQIAAQAALGDVQCEQSLQDYERRMAKALAHVINLFDPDTVVLGGGLSQLSRLYDNVPKLWGDYIFSDVVRTQLCPPRYGDASGVRGAAWLWNDAR